MKKQDEITTLELSGRLNADTCPEFEKRILDCVNGKTKRVILNFADLHYISSAGVKTLLKVAAELEETKMKIILCSMIYYIEELFEIAGYDSYFSIVPTVEEAVGVL